MKSFLEEIIRAGGEKAEEYFKKGVSSRPKTNFADVVTEADEAVSHYLVDAISRKFPTHSIHSEELKDDVNPGGEFEWVIDPIDGTRNFALGIPMWCVMIAVLKDNQRYMAGVYNPLADEFFYAEKGKGAFLNGRRIKVNSTASLTHSMGIIIADPEGVEAEKFHAATSSVYRHTGWVKNFGTMFACCHFAKGGLDFFYHNCGFDHDYLAPILISEEAGAIVTDCHGRPWQRGGKDLVMSNPKLHSELLKLFIVES